MKENDDGKIEFMAFLISQGMKREEVEKIADLLERDILAIEVEMRKKIVPSGKRGNQGYDRRYS